MWPSIYSPTRMWIVPAQLAVVRCRGRGLGCASTGVSQEETLADAKVPVLNCGRQARVDELGVLIRPNIGRSQAYQIADLTYSEVA